jgi:hypothetical protein
MTAEDTRLRDARERKAHWRRWDPYLGDRQWGTAREDYSPHGGAWDSFPHDHARSRVSRWGEDGILGISDNHQRLRFALAMWNEREPDPEGAPLRLDRRGGQSRRGREGVLLLPRYTARRGESPPQPPGSRVRAARDRRVRREPILRRHGRVRQGGDGRQPDPDHGHEPRVRAGAASPPAHTLVQELVVLGCRGAAPAPAPSGRFVRARGDRRASGDGWHLKPGGRFASGRSFGCPECHGNLALEAEPASNPP